MLSAKSTKNVENLFKIRSAIMSKKLEDVGGLSGVKEILSLSLEARGHYDYEKSLKILEPLIVVLKDQPFVSNETDTYISISDRMEKILYHQYCQTSSNQRVKNISSVCPMDWIYRQHALALLDLEDYDNALKAAAEAVKWNPASAVCRDMLALLYGIVGRWEDSLKETISAMKFAYLSNDLVRCFRSLRDYFVYKDLLKEAIYCSFMRSRYSSSNDVLGDIVKDMMVLTKGANFDYKGISDYAMMESCKKFGITPGFNPEMITIVKRCYEEAFLAGKSEKANYFAKIMSDLKTEQEKRNAVGIRQLVERSRNIVS